jgi:uncharacterized protein with PQ loop repeat
MRDPIMWVVPMGRMMTLADYSMTAFALLNGGRVLAYLPQIICIYRCRNGAAAVSLMTWLMFTAANVATVFYALAVSADFVVATVFALNALFCFVITTLVALRRLTQARAIGPSHGSA